MIDAGDRRYPRRDAGRDHDLVERAGGEVGRARPRGEPHVDAEPLETAREIADRLRELLARDGCREIHLAAERRRRFVQRHGVSAFGRGEGTRQPRRARADDRHALRSRRGAGRQIELPAGTRVHETGRGLVAEDEVEAGLVARDAGVDLVAAACARFQCELGVGQERTGERHGVGVAVAHERLGHLRRVDPVGRHDRDRHRLLKALHRECERRARHHVADRRHARLVPADAGVEDVGAGGGDRARLRGGLVRVEPAVDEVERRDPVDDQEILPGARARPPDDLDGKAQPVLQRAAPAVGAVVRPQRRELGDEIAFRGHDLDAVVARLLRQRGALDERLDRLLDLAVGEDARLAAVDGRGDGGGADEVVELRVAPGVQDLEADRRARRVHRVDDRPVERNLVAPVEHERVGLHPARPVGRDAAGDHQRNPAPRPLGVEGGEALRRPVDAFEPRVHRAHHDAVPEGERAERERREEMRVGGHRGRGLCGKDSAPAILART